MDRLSAAQKTAYDVAMANQFDTFKRPLSIYVEAQTANVSTSLTYSRFGPHDQNTAISVDNPAVTPVSYIVSGCILYGNRQPWPFISPEGAQSRSAQELKLREADGVIRIKVEATGYALMKDCQIITVDGFQFQQTSTPRPHGLIGNPTRWTFHLQRIM